MGGGGGGVGHKLGEDKTWTTLDWVHGPLA